MRRMLLRTGPSFVLIAWHERLALPLTAAGLPWHRPGLLAGRLVGRECLPRRPDAKHGRSAARRASGESRIWLRRFTGRLAWALISPKCISEGPGGHGGSLPRRSRAASSSECSSLSLSLTSVLVLPVNFLRFRFTSAMKPSETTPRQPPAQDLCRTLSRQSPRW